MEGYLINSIQEFDKLKLDSCYLVLFHVDKQPPHLGLIAGGEYFSLRYDKLQMGLDPETILKTVRTKKVPTLLFELDQHRTENPLKIFSKYQSIEKISCLFPIREVLFPDFYEDIQLVFDLLDKLGKANKILRTYSLNLEVDSGSYSIKKYTMEEVQEEIKRLKK